MADPDHIEDLDGFDRMTVRLYRSGLTLGACGVLVAGAAHLLGAAEGHERWLWGVTALGAALAATSMHLYDKRIRWIIAKAAALGFVLMAFAGGVETLLFHAGLGFVFVAYSAWALKEQFCFKIPGLRLVPLFLAVSLVPLVLDAPVAAGLLLLPAGIVLLWLAIAKWRMPLTHDIGDKSAYQI